MMEGYKIALLLGLFFYVISSSAQHVSVDCMMVYKEGGAPAVFNSPNCPQWVFPAKSSQNHLEKCQFATLQGRRKYQEDRMTCNPAMKIPFLGSEGWVDVEVSVAGMFDGHLGKEASELASKKFLEYLSLHVVFINYERASHQKPSSVESSGSIAPTDDISFYAILKEALWKTFENIDTEFCQKALRAGYNSGTTGTVALLVNGKLLVGYVGDSKAVLYSREVHDDEGNLEGSCAEELTRDHHPDREDERARIEASGGFVRLVDVHRVIGMMALSRSIGDIHMKSYGVIAEPEMIGWRNLTSKNSYLVIASDGIFESLTITNICHILHETSAPDDVPEMFTSAASTPTSSTLAELIVHAAYDMGSNDNLSAIVIPLESLTSST